MPPKKSKASAGDTSAATARPRRATAATPQSSRKVEDTAAKKRGRATQSAKPTEEPTEPPKKRSRPTAKQDVATGPSAAKSSKTAAPKESQKPDPEEQPGAADAPAPRKRGRPPKGGETTKITGDDAAAADQLEDELTDAVAGVDEEVKKPTGRKRGTGKAKAKPSTNDKVSTDSETTKNYWLMKAEQEDREVTLKSGNVHNTKFTIDDLKAREAPEPWDGVRNLVARNNMRNMKQGDLAFFYASGGKAKNKPGISGIMEIVKEHEKDWTVDDEDAYGYVEPDKRGTENEPKWSLVHVEFRRKLAKPVTLKALQKYAEAGGVLEGMQVLTNSRISVSKVTQKQWLFIVENLIDE